MIFASSLRKQWFNSAYYTQPILVSFNLSRKMLIILIFVPVLRKGFLPKELEKFFILIYMLFIDFEYT